MNIYILIDWNYVLIPMNQPTPDKQIEQIDRNIRANATSDLDKRF